MSHYLTIPQTSTLRSQKFPESFHNLGRDRIPSMVDLPWKQSERDEKSLREIIHILERVVSFSKALAELNTKLVGFCEDIKDQYPDTDNVNLALSAGSMQARVIDSLDNSLETILNQVMTLTCNTVLARRDTLLRDCKKLSCEDQLKLRSASFTDGDLFPTEDINTAENNLLKRAATSKPSHSDHKRRRYDTEQSFNSFRGQSTYRGRGRGSYTRGSRGSRGSRGQQSTRGKSSN